MNEDERKQFEEKRKKKEEKQKAKEEKKLQEANQPGAKTKTQATGEVKKKKKKTGKAGPNEMTAEERMNEFIKN